MHNAHPCIMRGVKKELGVIPSRHAKNVTFELGNRLRIIDG